MNIASSFIRPLAAQDIAAITAIYTWHVLHGCASFEETPPTPEETQARVAKVHGHGLPWLVAEDNGEIVGYCYATEYRPRPAYRFTIESSVYVAQGMGGKGLGVALMTELISQCQRGPWQQMLAVIGNGHQNAGSLRLHQRMGFREVGTLKAVGFKLGAWRDTLIMQRALADG